jgi:methylmalonyl-CoA mutase C-terminal domain/subunit
MELIKKKKLDDVLVFAGGIIPEEDIPALKKAGIAEIFGPGTPTDAIVKFVKDNLGKKK